MPNTAGNPGRREQGDALDTHTHCRTAGTQRKRTLKHTYMVASAIPLYLNSALTLGVVFLIPSRVRENTEGLISAESPTGRGNTPPSPWDHPDGGR